MILNGPSADMLDGGLIGLGGLALIAGVLVDRRRQRQQDRRVDQFKNQAAPADKAARPANWKPPFPPGGAKLKSALLWFVGLEGRGDWERPLPVLRTFLIAASVAVALALFAAQALKAPPAVALLIGLATLALGGRTLIRMERKRDERRFLEQFPDTIDMLARMIRSGLPVNAAARQVAAETMPPVQPLFARMGDQMTIGIPVDEVLVAMSTQIKLPEFRVFAVAVSLQQSTGGNLAEILDNLSEIMRKRRAIYLKGKAAASEVRMSALILGALPVLIFFVLLVVDPNYMKPLFSDPRGNVLLGVIAACLFLAAWTMRWLMQRSLRF